APSAAAPLPEKAAGPKVEAPLQEVKPAPEPESVEVNAKPVPAVAPKAEVKAAVAESRSLKPKPVPATKITAREAKPKPAGPKAGRAPKGPGPAAAPRKIPTKPMSLGFGRVTKPTAPASKVSSGRYAASVRAAIGRHRPVARGGGRATVAFSIGPAGGLR